MKIAELWVVIDTKLDAFNKGMSDAERSMVRVGKKFEAVGKKLTMMVTLPILAIGAAAVKMGADFEQSMMNAASVSGATGEELKRMEGIARDMGETTVFSARQAADAMYFMASAGWKVNDMGLALKPTLNLAAATQSDLAFATDTVVASLNQFQLGSAGAERLANVFAAAIGNSQATMEKLSISMRYVGPLFNSMGKEVEEAAATLMVLYNAGYDASMAGTALRMGMVKLMDGTRKTTDALARLNLTLKDVDPTTMHFADIIEILGQRGAKTKDVIDIFGVRAGPAFAALISQGGNAIRRFEQNITGTNAAAKMAEMQINTLKGSFKLLTSALTEAAIQIFKILGPKIKDLVDNKLKPAVLWFNSLSESTKKTGIMIAGLAAAAGPLLLILGKFLAILPHLKAAFVVLTGPIGMISAALLILGPRILSSASAFNKMKDTINEYNKVVGTAERKIPYLEKRFLSLKAALGKLYPWMKLTEEKQKELNDAIENAPEMINPVTRAIEKMTPWLVGITERYEKWKVKQDVLSSTLKEGSKEIENLAEKLGLILKVDLEKKLADYEKALIQYKEQLTPEKEKELRDEIKKLKLELGLLEGQLPKTGTAFDDFTDAIISNFAANIEIRKELIEGGKTLKETEQYLADIASQMGITTVDIQVGIYEWVRLFTLIAGISLPKLVTKFEETTDDIDATWATMNEQIEAEWISAFSSIITDFDNFWDTIEETLKAIGKIFADTIAKIVVDWITGMESVKTAVAGLSLATVGFLGAMFAGFVGIGYLWHQLRTGAERYKDALHRITKEQLKFNDALEDMEDAEESWQDLLDAMNQYLDGLDQAAGKVKAIDLEDYWERLIDYAKEFGLEGSKAMVELILKMRELGLESKALTDYIQDQLDRIPDALSGLIIAAEGSSDAIERMGILALATFNAMIASGVSWTEAISEMKNPLIALRDQYEALGLDANRALKKLFGIIGVSEAHAELFEAIDANRTILEALGNTGWLTQDALQALAGDAASFYNQLIAAGLSSEDALRIIAPTLQKLRDYAEAYGLEIDDATQALIDNAIQLGVVSEEAKKPAMSLEDTFEGFKKWFMDEFIPALKDAFGGLARAFGDDMEIAAGNIDASLTSGFNSAFGTAEERAGQAAGNISGTISGIQPIVNVGFDWDEPDFDFDSVTVGLDFDFEMPKFDGDMGGKFIGAFQHEGIAWRPQLARVAEKGPEAIVDIAKFQAGTSRLSGVLIPPRERERAEKPSMVINPIVNIYAQTLDDSTIRKASEKLFAAIEYEKTRRGYE